MPPLNILIKPASGLCNLNCRYCFYHSLQKEQNLDKNEMMSLDVLENIVKKAFEFAEGHVSFGFQGGEPTLRGLDFFIEFIKLLKKYNKEKIHINKYIQTNGLTINDKWADFFVKHNFLVGLSLDGPSRIHNTYRRTYDNSGSFSSVINTVKIFKKHNVEYNILYVVTSNTAKEGKKIYTWFKDQGFNYLQFIPCIDPMTAKKGSFNYSLSPKLFSSFLNDTFDCWHKDFINGKYISIRFIDNIVKIVAGQAAESCDMKGHCSIQNAVEANGNIYPCDFYVMENWLLGNIKQSSFIDVFNSEKARIFISESFQEHEKCRGCRWYTLCRNGCKRHRINNINYYCDSYQLFFKKNIDRIIDVIGYLK